MTKIKFIVIMVSLILFINSFSNGQIKMTKETLKDKIKGGWAGQTIGVTYGGPTEFRYQGSIINDYHKMIWNDSLCLWWYNNAPGLYDDLYMDLTFVDVYEKYGLNAPIDSFANAFANAGYMLWHANQAARYNILNAIKPPQSGFWKNNPHADCIDFQIEADFAGLMSPAMPNVASAITDKIGHIMNYGDGWYGGVFVSNMYSLAFVSKDIEYIVTEALQAVPAESNFYKCIDDVIKWYKKYPKDWKQTWFEVQKKWTDDIGCPDGVFKPFNIDAKVNAAYIVIGLLYGDGDFEKTLEISTRCGQDSDCNPSNAAGILGTVLGYSKIPEKWIKGVKPVEDMDFKYTTISLNKVYKIGYEHALKNIEMNGGVIGEKDVTIISAPIKTVRFEQSFPSLYPTDRIKIDLVEETETEWKLNFEGTGFVITGSVNGNHDKFSDYVAKLEIIIDDIKVEEVSMPLNFTVRKYEVYWNYELPKQSHIIKLKLMNPLDGATVKLVDAIIYDNEPNK